MARYRLLVFVTLLQVFQIIYCDNDSFNPFSPAKKSELKGTTLPDDKGLLFQNNEDVSEEKKIEKRRLLFKGEVNPTVLGERGIEKNFPSRRRTNFSEIETEVEISQQQETNKNWDNTQNRFSFPVATERNVAEFRARQPWMEQQPNVNFNNRQRINGFENNENFMQMNNPEFQLQLQRQGNNFNGRPADNPEVQIQLQRQGNNFNGRPMEMHPIFNANPVRNGDNFNAKMSITTLNERTNDDKVAQMNPQFASPPQYMPTPHYIPPSHSIPNPQYVPTHQSIPTPQYVPTPQYIDNSNMNYNGHQKHFCTPDCRNLCNPERGVIINFNSECSPPPIGNRCGSNFVHKLIFAQKPQMDVGTEMNIQESPIISSPRMLPYVNSQPLFL